MWHVDRPVTRAVWLVPVPSGAKVTAATGDPEIFTRLAQKIRPEQVSYLRDPRLLWGEGEGGLGAAADDLLEDAGQVQARSSTFTSFDSATRWAGEQGVSISSDLEAAFRPYLAKGWEILAVSLTPDGDQTRVSGNISPIDIAFTTSELVLPLAGGADLPGSYPARILAAVLADHQVENKQPAAGQALVTKVYGAWVSARDFGGPSGQRLFLTVFDSGGPGRLPVPYQDPPLGVAPNDHAYRERVGTWSTGGLAVPTLAAALVLTGGLVFLVVARRRHRRSR